MINKISSDLSVAIGHVSDGDIVLVSGFWQAGAPELLIQALVENGAKELTVVSNGAEPDTCGVAAYWMFLVAAETDKKKALVNMESPRLFMWLRGPDLNQRPLGYEPNELPDCSTSR